jgi:hypothetical protein
VVERFFAFLRFCVLIVENGFCIRIGSGEKSFELEAPSITIFVLFDAPS